ncbi:MAG: 4-(cytidine 5'-diphospho)-2-C-methyl-D-erythritol kinase [Dehalococcoidia bacterium]
MITISAYAKVNLTLEVLSKRGDGYHEISSVLQTISLADEISFEPAPEILFVSRDARVDRVDLLEEAVLKAANLLRQETGCRKGAIISLQKLAVPRAAGLGSSSSVPASVLKGLSELWALKLPASELSLLASGIGSDAPFFIYGGTALAKGRGEQITRLLSPKKTWLALLVPAIAPVPAKTARMYGMLNASHFTDGSATQRLVSELQQGSSLHSDMLCNTFESVAFDFFPLLGEYRQKFLDAGATRVHLAGAGPTLFALVSSRKIGEELTGRLRDEGLGAYLVHTL